MAVADVLFLVLMVVETTVGNQPSVLNSLVFQYNEKGPLKGPFFILRFVMVEF